MAGHNNWVETLSWNGDLGDFGFTQEWDGTPSALAACRLTLYGPGGPIIALLMEADLDLLLTCVVERRAVEVPGLRLIYRRGVWTADDEHKQISMFPMALLRQLLPSRPQRARRAKPLPSRRSGVGAQPAPLRIVS